MKLPKKPTILIDSREQKPVFDISTPPPANVAGYEITTIDAGDYTVKELSNIVIVERKANAKELYGNFILNKDRFIRQVERMRTYAHKYIVVEQTYPEFLNVKYLTFINPFKRRFSIISTIESWLISLSQTENIHFIFAGKENAPRIIQNILVKSYEYARKDYKRKTSVIQKSN